MAVKVKIDGLRELDRALGELPKRTGKAVLRRVLKKAGEPIAQKASELAPKDTGELAASISVSSRIKNTAGKAEYAAAMKAGLGKEAAVSALRAARREAAGSKSFAEIYVGPSQASTKKDAIKRIVQEFGSSKQSPQPYMRPAWDSQKDRALDVVKDELGAEIDKAAKRLARKAAKAKG